MGGVLIVARVISGLWWSGFRSLGMCYWGGGSWSWSWVWSWLSGQGEEEGGECEEVEGVRVHDDWIFAR